MTPPVDSKGAGNEPLSLYGVDVVVRKYVPNNEAVIVNKGDEIEYTRPDGKKAKMLVKEPNGIKIYNFEPERQTNE